MYIDKESLLSKFKNSEHFVVTDSGPYVNAFKISQKDQLFIGPFYQDNFRISENSGLGGMLEVIGTVNIIQFTLDKSVIKIKLQMGIVPVNLPQIAIIFLVILGLILMPITSAFLLLFSVISFFLAIWWLICHLKVRHFLGIVSKAIGIDNKW
ncbi:MAG TPA: hypothetical protein VIH57_15095 [Bacteroidales bacterium]